MYKIIKITFLLFIFSITLHAQEIYVCKSYTEKGEPIDASNSWEIKSGGDYLYILFDNEEKIEDKLVYLFLDKKYDDEYKPFDSKVLRNENKKSWLVYNYKFEQPGDYEIYFMDSAQNNLATTRITIKYKKSEVDSRVNEKSMYYDNSKIIFCERVFGGEPLKEMNSTYLGGDSVKVYVYLDTQRPIRTEKLLVDIWRKKNRSFQYDEFVETKKYKVKPEWAYTFFQYKFTKKGEYKISIYNDQEILIKSGYFTVK
jgi:hypothetical protein